MSQVNGSPHVAIPKLTDRECLLVVADNLEKYWGPLAVEVNGDATNMRLAREDAQSLREIASRLA